MKNYEKKQILLLFFLVCTLCSWQLHLKQADSDSLCNTDFLRLHIIANSNSQEDQALKLKVRDAILTQVQSDVYALQKEEGTVSLHQIQTQLAAELPELEHLAESTLRREGCTDAANGRIGIRWIPEKTYGSVSFPAGLYKALTITIGEGKGENWWCVLFPPLCLIDSHCSVSDPANPSPNQSIDREEYRDLLDAASDPEASRLTLRFKVVELFR